MTGVPGSFGAMPSMAPMPPPMTPMGSMGPVPGTMAGPPMPPMGSMMGPVPGTMAGPMPGSMAMVPMPPPFAMERSSISAMKEMPVQKMLDSRTMPQVPMPWAGQSDILRPGQPTGMGPDALSPLHRPEWGEAQRMPNAYRQYGYGNRVIKWSPAVPVPERNTGITINAEYPLLWQNEGREAAPYDYGIRNQNWVQQGPWVQPYDPTRDVPDWKHKMFGQYEQAVDLKQKKFEKDYNEMHYKDLARERDAKGVLGIDETARKRMELELVDDNELHQFWANPEAVMYDKLD